MLLKRLLVVLISMVLGTAITTFIVYFPLQTSIEEFWTDLTGIPYYVLTSFFIGCAIAIWLDKFMGTKILPE